MTIDKVGIIDLRKLSRRAMVALAARCARRALPLGRRSEVWDAAFARALMYAEMLVGGDKHFSMDRATDAARVAGVASPAGCAAIAAVAAVARSEIANDSTISSAQKAITASSDIALKVIHVAAASAEPDRTRVHLDTVLAAQADCAKLHQITHHQAGELGDAIDLSVAGPLGPLWPDGVPDWYSAFLIEKAENEDGEETQLNEFEPHEFLIDPGSASPEEIADLFQEFTALFRLLGGDCDLEFRVEDCREPILEEV